jgi:hypothetical protein
MPPHYLMPSPNRRRTRPGRSSGPTSEPLAGAASMGEEAECPSQRNAEPGPSSDTAGKKFWADVRTARGGGIYGGGVREMVKHR